MAGETQDYTPNAPHTGIFNGTNWDTQRSLQGLASTAALGRTSNHPGLPTFNSLLAVGGAIVGSTLDCVVSHILVTMAVTLNFSTAPSALSTQLQGSLDGNNWFNIGSPVTATTAGTTAVSSTTVPARYFRANVTSVTGGTGVSITVNIGVAG